MATSRTTSRDLLDKYLNKFVYVNNRDVVSVEGSGSRAKYHTPDSFVGRVYDIQCTQRGYFYLFFLEDENGDENTYHFAISLNKLRQDVIYIADTHEDVVRLQEIIRAVGEE